ncbi:zinc finger (C3HC4-type RING finger) family protein [Galdieria sulphuraria]|uniref:RING-type E3 ubiquitin transferase n=1 Tax=Galdieria sulphuraria TaxID=130081 RepID=M2XHA1_GALSU|nr:zinc finger (C3HC4-type RING finger) family protein [Galdieria sulphuraria]EME29457.1 zinc finger (C3HC4-type RING finger) family protein [Galdieria sulphuraria]|eukprot:XP_005705977.1 zinc finger (C3HC4-type RING finger) family protein [Galdieria sulphuraria]
MNDEGTSDSYEGKNKEQDVFSHGQQGNLSQSEIFCSICMEKFTESGNHYICCLSCGHIFGYSCITKWLKTRLICPTCNQKAKKRDVRRIYLPHTSIVMQDTTALEELKQQWQKEIDNKELLSNELCITKNQLKRLETSFAYLTQRYYELTREYQTLSQSVRNSDFVTKKSVGKFPLQLVRTLSLKNSRTFVFGKGTSIYSGYKEDSTHEYLQQVSFWSDHKSVSKHAIHESSIRDIRYLNPQSSGLHSYGLLLTCSNDKTLKIVCPQNMNVVLSYSLENVGWCCDWSANGLYMACGMKNGNVVIYDIRKTDGYLDSTKLSNCKGIHSVFWLTSTSLIAGGMDGVYYVDMATNRNGIYYQENILQLDEKQQDKPIFATCLEEMPSEGNRSMKSLIVSYRSSRSPTSHVIYSSNVVRPGSSACLFSYPQRFTQLVGGKNHLLLSRTLGVCWKDRHYFFTADESFRGSSLLWEWKSDNHSLQVIPETFPTCHSSPIYDVRWNRGLIDDVPDQALMGTLSKEELHIYKW